MKKYKLFLLLCLVILVVGCSYSVEINTNNDNEDSESASSISLVVPDVSGMTVEDAKSILKLNGFEVGEVLLIGDNDYEEDLVVKTDPGIGKTVKEKTLVNLYVSTSFIYEVEDYTGKNYLEVKNRLEDLGLIVERKEKSYLNKYEELTIVEQEPSVGTVLKSGDTVVLYIPVMEVLYPDFILEKWTISEVEEFCSKYEIVLVKKYQKTNSYSKGAVINQSRKAGSKVVSGVTLTITIAEN